MVNHTSGYREFLTDDNFIKWRLFSTEEQDHYWSQYIKENPHREADLQFAVERFKSVRLNHRILTQQQSEELLDRIIRDSISRIKRKRKIKYYWSAAACLIILVMSTFYFYRQADDVIPNSIVGEALPSEDIQLVSGKTIVDIKQNAEIRLSPKGNVFITETGREESSEVNLSKEEINKLIVPYGKRSALRLSDGTKIWLNSGTVLEFPTSFTGAERHINVKGEIYIEVARDENKPFHVHAGQLDARVYGTKFNLSSYPDNEESLVVLVEGKVEVKSAVKTQMLHAGELFGLQSGEARHEKVEVDEYISWKEGIFILNKVQISSILKKIGRYYNIEFKDNKSELMSRTCTGKLFLSDDMEQVISVVCAISNTTYKRVDNSIYILPN